MSVNIDGGDGNDGGPPDPKFPIKPCSYQL